MRVYHPKPNILELVFDTGFEACDATYRFSHYYEVDQWIGKITSREELDDFYVKTTGHKDSWKNRWAGSNIPDYAFEPFINGSFKNLTSTEKEIVGLVKKLEKPYYVIMHNGGYGIREHELAHALWYTNREYRLKALRIIRSNRATLKAAFEVMKRVGYSDKVLRDEVHVYAGIFYKHYLGAPFHTNTAHVPESIVHQLTELYHQYIK